LDQIIKPLLRRELSKRARASRRIAREVLDHQLGAGLRGHASVISVRAGVVTLEADASPLFHELEGFHRVRLLEGFRAAGLKVREVRVRLAPGLALTTSSGTGSRRR
jgi:hypothetical protein